MSHQNNSKPKALAPFLVVKNQTAVGISALVLIPAILASIVFNGGLIAVLYFLFQTLSLNDAAAMETVKEETIINADPVDDKMRS